MTKEHESSETLLASRPLAVATGASTGTDDCVDFKSGLALWNFSGVDARLPYSQS